MGTMNRYVGVPIEKKNTIIEEFRQEERTKWEQYPDMLVFQQEKKPLREEFQKKKENNGNNIQIYWCSNRKKTH